MKKSEEYSKSATNIGNTALHPKVITVQCSPLPPREIAVAVGYALSLRTLTHLLHEAHSTV